MFWRHCFFSPSTVLLESSHLDDWNGLLATRASSSCPPSSLPSFFSLHPSLLPGLPCLLHRPSPHCFSVLNKETVPYQKCVGLRLQVRPELWAVANGKAAKAFTSCQQRDGQLGTRDAGNKVQQIWSATHWSHLNGLQFSTILSSQPHVETDMWDDILITTGSLYAHREHRMVVKCIQSCSEGHCLKIRCETPHCIRDGLSHDCFLSDIREGMRPSGHQGCFIRCLSIFGTMLPHPS